MKDLTGNFAGGVYGLALLSLIAAIVCAFFPHIPHSAEAARPLLKSVRAQLRHTAPTLGGDGKANAWPWMKDLGLREKVIGQLGDPLP
jgi:hypothetical protein